MQDKTRIKRLTRIRKRKHIRKHVNGTATIPRLVVFRSLKNIYAQLVDDESHKTLTGLSSLTKSIQEEIGSGKSKKEIAAIVGKAVAEKAKSMNITEVVFDRGGYLYHGRIQALADGARKGGLVF
ncbi:50S ribosomal protein L18 [candidate division KSB1 bacterium]|nr:50S ribosomal protein L18 [candidate division KSB1 bacterium]